ncbi:ABC transporter permease [Actinomadura algeriensis]|uniref:Peptide/nickel transport system permease protein n=1 Tax=Actinomadura algeriensis TaxID=1679523 RepID=A0ABR9JWJ9_9ACTN|nr:ABC transporter permease [Actinomadura algeriensis]MBE1534952.1 peptide/nickel transport system permease protein [Actinomadura algeriensis]
MAAFLLRRTVRAVLQAVLGASLVYLLAAAALDPRAHLAGRTPRPPDAVIDARLARLNLDPRVPPSARYRAWAAGVLRGDLGRTLDGRPAGAELRGRLGVSVRLVLPGAVLGSAFGVVLGSWAAAKRGRAADRLVSLGTYVLAAVPMFVLAVLLQIAAVAVNDVTGVRALTWTGEPAPGAGGLERVRHEVLPTLVLALAQAALLARYQRGRMLDVLDAGFVRAARAKGLRRRGALLRHALRPALIPLTACVPQTAGLLLLGGMFAEQIFARHGLGEWLADAVARGDVNAVAAVGCLAACAVPAAALAGDVLHGLLDPRVRAA